MGECLAEIDEAHIFVILVDPVVPHGLFDQLLRHARSEGFPVAADELLGLGRPDEFEHGFD